MNILVGLRVAKKSGHYRYGVIEVPGADLIECLNNLISRLQGFEDAGEYTASIETIWVTKPTGVETTTLAAIVEQHKNDYVGGR